MGTRQVAEFYEVKTTVINVITKRHRDELVSDGMAIVGMLLRDDASGKKQSKPKKEFYYMLGLIVAIVLFNLIAFTTNKQLTKNQIVHIWMFTMAFHVISEVYLDFKYQGYWYFAGEFGWWHIWYSMAVYPVLPVSVLLYHKWICKIEKTT